MIGLYAAGDSWLHRLAPRTKLLALLLTVTVVGIRPRWWLITAALVLTLACYLSGRLPLGRLWQSIRWVLAMGAVLALVQVWINGPMRAYQVVGQLLLAVLLGNLVTLTTRVTDMVRTLSVVAVPLRPLGVRRDRLELLLGLTVGSIPRVAAAVTTAREAARARGLRPRLLVVVPSVLVTIVRQADEVGDAMAARGL